MSNNHRAAKRRAEREIRRIVRAKTPTGAIAHGVCRWCNRRHQLAARPRVCLVCIRRLFRAITPPAPWTIETKR